MKAAAADRSMCAAAAAPNVAAAAATVAAARRPVPVRRRTRPDPAVAVARAHPAASSFGEEEYLRTRQTKQREEWAAALRSTTDVRGAAGAGGGGRAAKAAAAGAAAAKAAPALPRLDPPPALAGVSVVLVAPLRPRTVGTVARLCSCFEALDLRLVAPRCDHLGRPALSASKGAQAVLRRAAVHESLEEALRGAGTGGGGGAAAGVAFTRWAAAAADADADDDHDGGDRGPRVIAGVEALVRAPEVRRALSGGGGGGGSRVALVFGREEFGLSDAEVRACALACELPMGRLSESLSLSHAAAIALSALYSSAAAAAAGTAAVAAEGGQAALEL